MDRTVSGGFTLIELMVVVALIGVIASMALPAFNTMIENNRRVAAVNEFLTSIHHARSEAITRNQFVSICRSNADQTACGGSGGAWRTGWIAFRDHNRNGVFEVANDEVLFVGEGLRGTLDLVSPDFPDRITFHPNGRVFEPVVETGEWYLCTAGVESAVRTIRLDRTGRPRVVPETDGSCS